MQPVPVLTTAMSSGLSYFAMLRYPSICVGVYFSFVFLIFE